MKILIIGYGPLPNEKRGISNAGGLRTQQFLEGIQGRHDVSLVVVENEKYANIKQVREETIDGKMFRHISVSKSLPNIKKVLKEELHLFLPDVAIGVNTYPCFLLSQIIPKEIPFWADLNGWVMGEVQAQAYSMDSNAYLFHGYEMERKILKRADKISVVSTPQKYVTIGEISSIGRLSKDNFRHQFVEVIKNSCRSLPYKNIEKGSLYRGKVFPKNAITLLWLGGFNAWADEETLFSACEKAMAKNLNIHFISTGETLLGIDEKRYPNFQRLVQNSRFRNNFHLLGWIPAENIPQLLCECDMGINVDVLCAETEIGARNRLNEMLRYGLPIISTCGAEITHILEKYNAGIICPSGSPKVLSKSILFLADSPKERENIKKEGEILIKSCFSATITQKPLLSWLSRPIKAPDSGKAVCLTQKTKYLMAGIHFFRQKGFWAFLQKIRSFMGI